jgi:uncharacterized protein YjcR
MALRENQLEALHLEIEKYPLEMTLTDIAKQVEVDIRTLRRWRASDDWARAMAELTTDEMKELFVSTVKANKGNAALWKVYWDRFGGEDEDLAEAILQMGKEEALTIAEEAARWWIEQQPSRTSAMAELFGVGGPD